MYSLNASSLDFGLWPHMEGKVCKVCHANIMTLEVLDNVHWGRMDKVSICRCCPTFPKKLKAVIKANGAYIVK